MEKAVLIRTDGQVQAVELDGDMVDAIHQAIGCDCFETARAGMLESDQRLVVDESGVIKGREVNMIATYLMGPVGYPIVGDALIMAIGMRNGEPDLVGLGADLAEVLAGDIVDAFEFVCTG